MNLLGRLIVPAGAAGLLVEVFHRLGHRVMDDEAHVGLVDAHPEGDGRHDGLQLPASPLLVYLAPHGSL